LFELVIAMFLAIIALHYTAQRLGLPPFHPLLLDRYQRRTTAIADYVERVDNMRPLLHAHFDLVLAAVATGRRELIRLHRAGEIDDDTLHELERDLDLEELSAISAKA
jgi:hypothetical protein